MLQNISSILRAVRGDTSYIRRHFLLPGCSFKWHRPLASYYHISIPPEVPRTPWPLVPSRPKLLIEFDHVWLKMFHFPLPPARFPHRCTVVRDRGGRIAPFSGRPLVFLVLLACSSGEPPVEVGSGWGRGTRLSVAQVIDRSQRCSGLTSGSADPLIAMRRNFITFY